MRLLILIFVTISDRSFSTTTGGPGPHPLGFGDDDACVICMDRLLHPNDRKYPLKSWAEFNLTNSSVFFPDCHGSQFCEPCIFKVRGHSSELQRKCPICRRSTPPLKATNLPKLVPTSVQRQIPDPKQNYEMFISRLQREDKSPLKHFKICSSYHPLRHCIRNQYYSTLECLCCRPVFSREYLYREPRGCFEEFGEMLLSDPHCVCLDCINVMFFAVGNAATGCCCFMDCFCGMFCRDFCMCEPPMNQSWYAQL